MMYDGVNAGTVPNGAWAVAGYVNGLYQSYDALVAKFPSAVHLPISVNSTGRAKILDVENGDAIPAQAPGWVADQRAAGDPYPVVYCNQANTWPAVKAAFAAQPGIAPPLYWVAAYVSNPAVPPALPDGAIALQYYDFGGYDASVVADYWPGVDPAPQPVPQEDEVAYYPIQVGPDPITGDPWSCGVASWPTGAFGQSGVPHVLQLVADPGGWGDTEGQFRLDFDMESGPDVDTTVVSKPSESVALELTSVPGYNPALCRGVLITRPDGKKWPWGGHAA
jgi:hypothetical protein